MSIYSLFLALFSVFPCLFMNSQVTVNIHIALPLSSVSLLRASEKSVVIEKKNTHKKHTRMRTA